jgi:hypothetical protein
MPATVVCFERFRADRDRQREQEAEDESKNIAEGASVSSLPFQDRLASVLSPRQIAHRRTMLDYGTQLRTTMVSPISRNPSRSRSFTSASWIRSIGSMKGSLLSRKD